MKRPSNIRLINHAGRTPEETQIYRLARSLCAAYNIQQGEELVMVLGNGLESCNQKAVETWVRNSLQNLDEPAVRDMLNHLVRRLGENLEQWEASRWL